MSDDRKISQRYRELAREEPPPHLDDAILARSRRATRARPTRWYAAVAVAAVIVLAVAVTVHVERERPSDEVAEAPVAAPASPREEPPVVAQAPAEAPKREVFARDPKPAPSESATGARKQGPEQGDARLADLYKAQPPAPATAPPVASSTPAEAENRARADAERARGQDEARSAAARSQRAASDMLAAAAVQSPEQWLLGIDDLKRQGKHEEAERQLAEFRKRYPNYRIPEAIAEKFEKR